MISEHAFLSNFKSIHQRNQYESYIPNTNRFWSSRQYLDYRSFSSIFFLTAYVVFRVGKFLLSVSSLVIDWAVCLERVRNLDKATNEPCFLFFYETSPLPFFRSLTLVTILVWSRIISRERKYFQLFFGKRETRFPYDSPFTHLNRFIPVSIRRNDSFIQRFTSNVDIEDRKAQQSRKSSCHVVRFTIVPLRI